MRESDGHREGGCSNGLSANWWLSFQVYCQGAHKERGRCSRYYPYTSNSYTSPKWYFTYSDWISVFLLFWTHSLLFLLNFQSNLQQNFATYFCNEILQQHFAPKQLPPCKYNVATIFCSKICTKKMCKNNTVRMCYKINVADWK